MKGSEFIQSVLNLPLGPQREEAIYQAATGQNSWIRWPMTLVVVQGKGHEVGFVVSDDYFAIGEPDDYVRVPMNPVTAQRIADRLGFMLPTAREVDLIWRAAPIKLEPQPMTKVQGSKAQMASATFAEHNAIVDSQLAPLGLQPGIRAGHKKDVVLTNRLQGTVTVKEVTGPAHTVDASKQVAIYGWHRTKPGPDCSKLPTIPGLCPIQGLSIVHDNQYADYSHGVRMISPEAMLDGQSVPLLSILTNPELASILSHEGALQVLRQPHTPIRAGTDSSFLPRVSQLPPANKTVVSSTSPLVGEQKPPTVLTAGLTGGGKTMIVLAAAALGYYGVDWWLQKQKRKRSVAW